MTFIALPVDFSPEAGIIATSGAGELRLKGTGAYVDSYTSPGYDGGGPDGLVKSTGDVSMSGNSQIDGDVRSGGNVTIGSAAAQIDGNANWTKGFNPHPTGSVTGDNHRIDGISPLPPIDRLVTERAKKLSASNDNDDAGTDGTLIRNGTLDIDGDSATLEAGQYSLETLSLEGETLYLDTTDGDIAIAVRKWVKLDTGAGSSSEIVVEGDGDVRLFVASEGPTSIDSIPGASGDGFDEGHFIIEGSSVSVPDRESPRFQVFGPETFVGAVGGGSGAEVTATVIAPTTESGPGGFYVKQGDVYGAIVTGEITLGQFGQIHFDRRLVDEQITLAPNIPRLEFLYLTESEIEVGEP